MSLVSKLIKHAASGSKKEVAKIVDAMRQTGHKAADFGKEVLDAMEDIGPGALIGGILGGPAGALIGGTAGGLLGGRRRKPPRKNLESDVYQCGIDRMTGEPLEGKEPFAVVSRLNIAAGAQAVSTDLGDFFTTAATTDLSANNQFPYEFDADEAKLFVSGNLAASYIETLAVLAGVKVIERVDTTRELAQYSVTDLALTYSQTGVVTSGASATVFNVSDDGVPFEAHYSTRRNYAMVLRTVRAFTSVGTLDFTLILTGTR